jgi:hypothetical protein
MIAKNKISREVKLLACDLMWKICVLFPPLVNSRKNGDEHRHSYWLKPREFCLVSRPGELRGSSAEKTIQFNLRA